MRWLRGLLITIGLGLVVAIAVGILFTLTYLLNSEYYWNYLFIEETLTAAPSDGDRPIGIVYAALIGSIVGAGQGLGLAPLMILGKLLYRRSTFRAVIAQALTVALIAAIAGGLMALGLSYSLLLFIQTNPVPAAITHTIAFMRVEWIHTGSLLGLWAGIGGAIAWFSVRARSSSRH
jgi:hypothetical protein